MSARALAAALALVLALGDPAWAVTVARSAPRVMPAGVAPAGAWRPAVPAAGLTGTLLAGPVAPGSVLPATPVFSAPQDAPGPAALPQLTAAAEPAARPGASAAEEREEGSRRWDAAEPSKGGGDAVSAAPADAPVPSGLSPSAPGAAAARRGIPLPRVGLARAGQLAGWTALTLAAALGHLPFDRVAPLILGVVLGLSSGVMTAFFAVAAQESPGGWGWGGGEAPKARVVTEAEKADLRARVDALAAEAGLPAPKTVETVDLDQLNAQAAPDLVRVYGGVLDLPRDQQDAILRHEIAHIRHNDSVWTAAGLFTLAVPASVALMAGMNADWLAALAAPAFVGALALFGESKKRAEHHADQYAVSRAGTAAPLIAAFREMKRRDDEAAAVPPKTRLEAVARRASAAWDAVARLWSAHPPLEARVARLRRLDAAR
ncbi:MAG: M48 family metalloprotease [Elusimicrobiota bacterium]|nr:M48 family metalloprotease [Elusimicrobiota bacterium]